MFSRRALGISIGLVWGLFVLLATWWLVIKGSSGITISKLSKFFPGYSLSWTGGILGFVWGFIDGFIAGFLIAWFYNIISSKIKKSA